MRVSIVGANLYAVKAERARPRSDADCNKTDARGR